MNVHELIFELQKCEQDHMVLVTTEYGPLTIQKVQKGLSIEHPNNVVLVLRWGDEPA